MAATDVNIRNIAHLARIEISADEEKNLQDKLGHILEFIAKLKELDVTNVEPTAHAVPMVNVTRADEIRPSLPHEAAMRNAPSQANGLFLVPKIVE